MLQYGVTHPKLLRALAESGSGSRILVAGANYPVTAMVNPRAQIVYLNFVPGIVCGADVVQALARIIAVESAFYMAPGPEHVPAPIEAYRAILGAGVPFSRCDRFEFYEYARGGDVGVVIATGEQQTYSSALLTVGAVE